VNRSSRSTGSPLADAIDWSLAKRLFSEALELPAEEHDALLSAHRAEHRATVQRVASLLEAHGRTDGFLVEPKPRDDADASLPNRIGPYTPLERLGEGGFGVVYRATQTEPIARDVAIKVLRTGLDTPEVVARFRDERQYLAQLDHSDVVTIFDAGVTEDGTAYLVMEYFEGDPVTNFAARLTLSERLRLFARVCRAVHAVHQRGVMHRDLKPSNIIVHHAPGDDTPRVRIIDFGIAAAVQRAGRDTMTAVGAPLGTPRYASPEQARGDAGVDTRTDVYSLGMILCEMLTGKLPRQASSRDAPVDTQADRPSTLHPPERSRLRGDLDRIVLKAIDGTIDRRYDSAASLADDVGRYLRGEPVLATKPSVLYTASKFVARRRTASALIGVALLAIVSGLATLSIGIERARSAERDVRSALDRVSVERDRADAINAFLLGDVIDSLNPDVTGQPIPPTNALLARMSDLGDEAFADNPATAQALLGRVGHAQRSLGLYADAARSHEREAEASSRAFGTHDERTLYARIDALLSRLSARSFDGAEREMVEIVRLTQDHFAPDHPVALRAQVHASHIAPDVVAGEDAAELPGRIEHAGLAGSDLHIESLMIIGDLLARSGDPRGLDMLLRGVELAARTHGASGVVTLDFANRIGRALRALDRHEEAIALLEESYADARRVYGPGTQLTLALLTQLSLAALLGDRPDEGLGHAQELYANATENTPPNEPFASIGAMLIARGHEELGHYEEAVPWRRERLDRMLVATTRVDEHHVPRARLVTTLVRADRIAEAETEFQDLRKAGGPHEQFRLSAALTLAQALKEADRAGDALSLLEAERDSDAYTSDLAETLQTRIEALSDAP